MATYHLSHDLRATDVSVRQAHATPCGETRLCLDIGEDLSIYLTAIEWAALADLADAALQRVAATATASPQE